MATKYRHIVYIAGFFFSISIALSSYINSSFLKGYISENVVSLVYVVASILTILAMLEMPKFLTLLGNRKATILLSLTCFLSMLFLANGNSALLVIPSFIIFFITQNLIFISLDIFIEDFSTHASTGKLRGLYLVVLNLAWVVSQTISGSILEKSSYQGLYTFGSFFMLVVAVVFLFSLRKFKDPEYKKVPILKTFRTFLKNKKIKNIYLINFILKFFFVWMVVYTPIYLHEYIGFNWQSIGLIFTIMLLPFVLLTYPLGKISDKIGEKKLLILGFVIIILATLAIPLIEVPLMLIWAMILFATRVGAATIEVMSESYFFKVVNEENADEISFFRNTGPMSFVVAPLIAIPVTSFLPNPSDLFFVLAGILTLGLIVSLRIKDVK